MGRSQTRWLTARAVVGAAALIAAVAACAPPSSAPDTPHVAATSIVFSIDVSQSVPERFRRQALRALADAVDRLPARSLQTIYIRKINSAPGVDSASVVKFVIPAIGADCSLYDRTCKKGASNAESRLRRAKAITNRIRNLRLKSENVATLIRGAIAAGGQILQRTTGNRWLVLATDLKPSSSRKAQPRPNLDLTGIHVRVILSCNDSLRKCDERRNRWRVVIRREGHAADLIYLPASVGSGLLRR